MFVGIQRLKGSNGPPGRGEKGNIGPRGLKGEIGYQGVKGDKGENGITGLTGPPGFMGQKGTKGEIGDQGGKGEKGIVGPTGAPGTKGQKGVKGELGDHGLPGAMGVMGHRGPPGSTATAGTVYVRWGHDQCPSTAQLVYSGRAGGSHFRQSGGGSNPQCLPLNPTYLSTQFGKKGLVADMHGAEYETSPFYFGRSVHHHVVVCAVCYVSQRSAVYMVPARHTCPTGWTTEYNGYLMAERWSHNRSQYTCVDKTFKTIYGTGADHDGLTFYPDVPDHYLVLHMNKLKSFHVLYVPNKKSPNVHNFLFVH